MDTPQNEQSTPTPENEQQHFYFLICGEIEYLKNKHSKDPLTMRVNTVYQSPIQGLSAAQLAKCQVNLQMNFHGRYSRTHQNPPIITYCLITGTSFLGIFSEKEFLAGAPTQDETVPLLPKEEAPPTKGS